MAAWLTSACRLRGPVALYFGRVGGSGRATRDQQEDARELEHPFHQSRGALEAARLHTCGRSDRARRGSSTSPASSGSIATASVSSDFRAAGGADVREPQGRHSRRSAASFQDVVKLNNYLTDMKYLPIFRAGARQLSGRRKPPGQHDLAISGLAREGALLEIEAVAVLPAAARAQAGGQGARRPRDYQSFAAETKVSSAKIGSRTTPDHTM